MSDSSKRQQTLHKQVCYRNGFVQQVRYMCEYRGWQRLTLAALRERKQAALGSFLTEDAVSPIPHVRAHTCTPLLSLDLVSLAVLQAVAFGLLNISVSSDRSPSYSDLMWNCITRHSRRPSTGGREAVLSSVAPGSRGALSVSQHSAQQYKAFATCPAPADTPHVCNTWQRGRACLVSRWCQ